MRIQHLTLMVLLLGPAAGCSSAGEPSDPCHEGHAHEQEETHAVHAAGEDPHDGEDTHAVHAAGEDPHDGEDTHAVHAAGEDPHDGEDTHAVHAAGEDPHDGEDTHADHAAGEDPHDRGDAPAQRGDTREDHEEVVHLSDAQLNEFGIEVSTAAAGSLDQHVELPGEIVLNPDRLAHVVPRVSGIVRRVGKSVGDSVEAGEILAVLESRELAAATAAYFAATERVWLAEANFTREADLWDKRITSEQEYLNARQALAEARIELRSAEQQMHALGFSDAYLKRLLEAPDSRYTRYLLRAPFAGTIIEKHLTLGENVDAASSVFTIADLSSVWVNIDVYQKDLGNIRRGQGVLIEVGHDGAPVTGTIDWVSPIVGEQTRAATARIVLPNPDRQLLPGQFVTARVAIASEPVEVAVPQMALQTFEERTVVFVRTEDGFEPRPVEIGRSNADLVEVVSGLFAGQTYVSRGAFTLKAQLSKGAFGDGHNH